jgi:hypothetical protein
MMGHLFRAQSGPFRVWVDRGRDCFVIAACTDRRCIEESDFTHSGDLDRDLIAHLGALDFIASLQNVVFLGRPGTGKTRLVTGITPFEPAGPDAGPAGGETFCMVGRAGGLPPSPLVRFGGLGRSHHSVVPWSGDAWERLGVLGAAA